MGSEIVESFYKCVRAILFHCLLMMQVLQWGDALLEAGACLKPNTLNYCDARVISTRTASFINQ